MSVLYIATAYFAAGALVARYVARPESREAEYVCCLLWPLVAYAALGALLLAARSPEEPAFCEASGKRAAERPGAWREARAGGFGARWHFAFYYAPDLLGVLWWPVVLPFALFAAAYDFVAPPRTNAPR